MKTLDDNSAEPLATRIKNVEKKIKTTVQVNAESAGPNLDQVSSIVKYKVASRQGITKLFVAVFDRLGIATSERLPAS